MPTSQDTLARERSRYAGLHTVESIRGIPIEFEYRMSATVWCVQDGKYRHVHNYELRRI
jgi:hypothetical protein